MADPRTKEELLEEIKNKQSDNESYAKFKASLQSLVQDIDSLMIPTEEGWKLMDQETTESLYEKYSNTAKHLNAYLKETANSNDPKENELRDVCTAFRHFFAADMEVVRKYRNAHGEQKSMPTLFEEARSQTVALYNNDLDIKGGALSSRIPMKVLTKKSGEMDGFYTKAEYFDPAKSIQAIMDKEAEKIEDPVGQALCLHFTEICKEFFRARGFDENKEPDNFKALFASIGEFDKVNKTPVIKPSAFASGFASIIRTLGADNVADICDLDEDDVLIPEHSRDVLDALGNIDHMCHKLAWQWNGISCMQSAHIDYKARIDIRNVAMSDVADLLGVGELICEAHRMKVRDKDGNESEGIFMAKARGVDPDHPGPGYQNVRAKDLIEGDAMVLKQLADLQVVDYICGNVDRHGGNMFYIFDENKKIKGIQGIDNDLSFGTFTDKDQIHMNLMPPKDMGVISKSMADRILALDPAQLTYTLYGTLDKEEVEAARIRLENMKEAITRSREIVAKQKAENPEMDAMGIRVPFGHLREIKDKEWHVVRMKDLYRREGPKNIFRAAADVMQEFPAYSTLPPENVRYAETGAANRATDIGIFTNIKKTLELKTLLSQRTKTGRSSDNYRNVQDAVNKHLELLMKIGERMGKCQNKVKAGTAETEEIFNQFVTETDMEKIRASERKILEMTAAYSTNKMAETERKERIPADLDPAEKKRRVMNALSDYTKARFEAIDLISETFKNGQTLSAEEKESLTANHRKAVEDTVREIRKNPEGPAAGPKNPVHKAPEKKQPPTL